jgi:hypothetical protein
MINRIAALFEMIKEAVEAYTYLVSWKEPLVTSASMIFFVQWCIYFDPAYVGALLFILLILLMALLAFRRCRGNLKDAFVKREVERNLKVRDVLCPCFYLKIDEFEGGA